MAELKNIRIAISGIYEYAKEELPSLRLSLDTAPGWVEDKHIYKVYRPASVLAAACEKFKLLPLTHHHPMVPVDECNFKDLTIGYTGENPWLDYLDNKDEVGIRSNVLLYDTEALDAYEKGERQLSPGYIATFEWSQGTDPKGNSYDIIMKEITEVNHLALLPAGRGGADAVVMDSAANFLETDNATPDKVLSIFDLVQQSEDGAPKGNDNASKDHINADEELGHDYSEYKGTGQSAVNHLMEAKSGQVKGAFTRRDIGDIDICWGKVKDPKKHTGYGIAHILDKHGQKAVDMLGEIIERGTVKNASNNNIKIIYKKYNVILSRDWYGEDRRILISGFDKSEGTSSTIDATSHYMTATRQNLSDNIANQGKISNPSIFAIVQMSIFERVKHSMSCNK